MIDLFSIGIEEVKIFIWWPLNETMANKKGIESNKLEHLWWKLVCISPYLILGWCDCFDAFSVHQTFFKRSNNLSMDKW